MIRAAVLAITVPLALAGCATTEWPESRKIIACDDIPVFPSVDTLGPEWEALTNSPGKTTVQRYLSKVARSRAAIADACREEGPPQIPTMFAAPIWAEVIGTAT